jgi:hypothetical protein
MGAGLLEYEVACFTQILKMRTCSKPLASLGIPPGKLDLVREFLLKVKRN